MKNRIANSQAVSIGAITLLLACATPTWADKGNQGNPRILPPNASAFGESYGGWSERWWQWCFSLPTTHHPLFDTADGSAGQQGQVWFIGGNFTGVPVTRDLVIPPGTALFFPIINHWADNTDCADGQIISDGLTEAALRSLIGGAQDQSQNVSCTIDGVAVQGLSDAVHTAYRVTTPTPGGFSYTL